MSRSVDTPVLIIGSGIAGLSAAVALADKGIDTLVITGSAQIEDSNTRWAQGGIISDGGKEDNPESLIEDILEAGCRINYLPAVQQLAYLGPKLVQQVLIERAGVEFDRDVSGYHLTREGGHKLSRILHHGDESGKAIESAMVALTKDNPRINFLTGTTAVNLLMTSFHCRDRSTIHDEARCFGAFVYDQNKREVYPIFSQHTILATGGIGQLFLHSTNSKYSRGDGIALAHRAGCRLEALEYLQFHPTTFYHKSSRRFLISEALRGEGAILVNESGERFLSRYLPDYSTPELAPRDRVAKAIHEEMLSSGTPCVYLDISHKPKDWVKERFPFVYRSCLENGIDMTTEPIPVVPGAHYHCGGVWVRLDGSTSIPRLSAVGETSCTGLHGANRLASTSLLEGLVWGTRAGSAVASSIKGSYSIPAIEEWRSESAHVDPSFLAQDWSTLKNTMWNYVGLIKTDARLKRAEGILVELARGIDSFYRNAALSDELIGLRHASLTALLVLDAAKRNPRSLGCYLRETLAI